MGSDILLHTLAYSGILWHTLSYSGILHNQCKHNIYQTDCNENSHLLLHHLLTILNHLQRFLFHSRYEFTVEALSKQDFPKTQEKCGINRTYESLKHCRPAL